MEKTTPQFIWNGIDLEALRQVMDEPSDNAIEAIYHPEESTSMRDLAAILKKMAKNDEVHSKNLPPALHDFLDSVLEMTFTEEDIEKFNRTHEIWKQHGMNFVFILFFRGLPYTYMAERPANVLHETKLLETKTDRRVIETAQFVFDVMEKNWWEPDKRGILTALKIRIMHSAMRHIILYSGEKQWNEEWGKPISQEDLIATNQVFSLEFFKGMKMLGKPLSKEDQEAWFHTWKTIGKIMGVQDKLLADTVEEAWELQHKIYAHLFNDETKVGIHLADALVETIHNFYMPKKLVLFLMKTMLADEQFPDCFERMLGPTYKKDFEDLFVNDDSQDQEQKKNLRKEMHAHAMDCYNSLKENKTNIKHPPHHTGFFEKIIIVLLAFFGMEKSKVHMVEVHLEQLHKILHHNDTGEPLEELEEDAILDLINVFGGIIVAVLSAHFREGKESGFRIPKNLQENWALKG